LTEVEGGDSPQQRYELLRALGSLCLDSPSDTSAIAKALGLKPWSAADHTQLFVLELPPYASIHLGPEGKLGGEGADRVAGMWRAIGLEPPADADHLGYLLALYASLGEGEISSQSPQAARRLAHARRSLLFEHLWSWVPSYLDAVGDYEAGAHWAGLLRQAIEAEVTAQPTPGELPAALVHAPAGLAEDMTRDELLDAVVAPVRSGFVLTFSDLRRAGETVALGVRRGERRYALAAMLDQEPTRILTWLATHASKWHERHLARQDPTSGTWGWWARRAQQSAQVLARLADSAQADAESHQP
jgi:TorA maturation chaperone TorD